MKKLYLLLFLLIFPIGGCDSGSGSGSGSGGGVSMNGNWSGQWAAKVQVSVFVDDPNNPGKFIKETSVQPLGGPLSATLQLNGRQLSGTISATTILGNQPAQFSATVSNPGGNIEVGTAYVGPYSISFHGTYNSQQIYCLIGPSSSTASGTIFEGNFTLTK
jgi:hypothetical protein